MSLRIVSAITAVVAAVIGVFIAVNLLPSGSQHLEEVNNKLAIRPHGRNNTVLFVSNSEYGLSNVLLATSYAMLVQHPDIEVHFATFDARKEDMSTLSNFAKSQNAKSNPIVYHQLIGPNYGEALLAQGTYVEQAIQPPGFEGLAKLCKDIQKYLMPWDAPEYFELFKQVKAIIEEVDPAVVAGDALFGPGLDATKEAGRRNAIVSPNALKDNFADKQMYGEMFWKYPVMGSGFPYPLPWSLIPANIYANIRFIYSVLMTPDLKRKKNYLKERGISDPLNFFRVYNENMTWITQSSREADFPIEYIPENVKTCGPIYLDSAPAVEQDPELAAWLSNAPTMLINLGSSVDYDKESASEMAHAIKAVLDQTNVQVLWKFNRRKYAENEMAKRAFSDEFLDPVKEYLDSGRFRMEKWIKIDPAAMMKTGDIVASVHHGGGNCYHEAVGMGVPHIVLPMWVDLYDYATRVEYLGIGVWANKETAPSWTAGALTEAFLKVLGNDTAALKMREKAKKLGDVFKGKPGSICSADELAKLARMGY